MENKSEKEPAPLLETKHGVNLNWLIFLVLSLVVLFMIFLFRFLTDKNLPKLGKTIGAKMAIHEIGPHQAVHVLSEKDVDPNSEP